jgi:hypothetical protein
MGSANDSLPRVRSFKLMSLARRVKDIAIETAVGVALVAAFVIYLFKSHTGGNRNWTPIVQIGNTAIVFGFLIPWFRHEWGRVTFWAAIGALLVGHAAIYVLVIGPVRELPLAYYALLNVIELVLFTPILGKLTARDD